MTDEETHHAYSAVAETAAVELKKNIAYAILRYKCLAALVIIWALVVLIFFVPIVYYMYLACPAKIGCDAALATGELVLSVLLLQLIALDGDYRALRMLYPFQTYAVDKLTKCKPEDLDDCVDQLDHELKLIEHVYH